MMINREDMLELTRRMTPKRTSMTRIAGAYLDRQGFIDGTFNTSFLKLNTSDQEKNLALAKQIPFSKTNDKLKEYRFSPTKQGAGSMYQLLSAIRGCGLKNDALMDLLYDQIAENYQTDHDYAIFIFHGIYDVPVKFQDHQSYYESEDVYEYIIGAICPLKAEYEPDLPECGFLFPAFSDRTAALDFIDVYQADSTHPHRELLKLFDLT